MARVTVEDCIEVIPSRFELVALATQRAKAITAGSPVAVPTNNDKNPVIALREIADGLLDPEQLRTNLIDSYRNVNVKDKFKGDVSDDDDVIDDDDAYTGSVQEEMMRAAEQEDLLDDDGEDDAAGGMYADDDVIDDEN